MKSIAVQGLSLLLISLFLNASLFGADLKFTSLSTNPSSPSVHRPIVFQGVVSNGDEEPVPGFMVLLKVSNTASGKILLEKVYNIAMLDGRANFSFNTNSDLFYLNNSEAHTVEAEIIFEFDPDPTNNFAQVNFIPQSLGIELQVEQWNGISPISNPLAAFGAIGVKVPKSLFQKIKAPMFQFLCGENENLFPCFYNFPPPLDETNMVWIPIDFSLAKFKEGTRIQDLQVSLLITDAVWNTKTIPWNDYLDYNLIDINTIQNGGGEWKADALVPPLLKSPINFVRTKVPEVYYQLNYPNYDLGAIIPANNSGYAGDQNASGISTSINNYKWLSNQYPTMLDNGWNSHELKEVLSRDALRTISGGTSPSDLFLSELNYEANLRLDLHTRTQMDNRGFTNPSSPNLFQSNSRVLKVDSFGMIPNFTFLKNELDQKAAVSLLLGFYNSQNIRIDGSWISVCGYVNHTDYKGIYYIQDINDSKAGGNRIFYSHWHSEVTSQWSRLTSFDQAKYNNWVECIYSKKIKPHEVFAPIPIRVRWHNFLQPEFLTYNISGDFEIYIPSHNKKEIAYLNIFAKNETSEWIWLSRNVPLLDFKDDYYLHLPFDYSRLRTNPDPKANEVFSVYVDCGRAPHVFQPEITNWKFIDEQHYTPVLSDVDIKLNPVEEHDHMDRRTYSNLPEFKGTALKDTVYRGCDVPNIDLDSTKHNPESEPETQGDYNACGPASAANSMEWLEKKFPDKIKSGVDHRTKMNELSRLMKRKNRDGVYDTTFIEGKLAFIDKYKLPIKVKFQRCCHWPLNDIMSPDSRYGHSARNEGDTGKPFRPRWDWLVKEMKEDEDVELFLSYYDVKGDTVRGRHAVVVTGVSKVGDAKGIWYKDDHVQTKPDGTGERFVHWETDSLGYPYLAEESNKCVRTYITDIISESCDTTVKFKANKKGKIWEPPMKGWTGEIDLKSSASRSAESDSHLNKIEVLPNPSLKTSPVEIALIDFAPGLVNYEITDLHGKFIEKGERLIFDDFEIIAPQQLTKNPSGVYVLRIKHSAGMKKEKIIRL